MSVFNSRITLQSNTPIAISGGCSTASWGTVTTFWGNIADVNVRESEAHNKGQQITGVRILARYTTSIDKKTCRLLHNGNVIHIESVSDKTNRKNEIIIMGRYEKR